MNDCINTQIGENRLTSLPKELQITYIDTAPSKEAEHNSLLFYWATHSNFLPETA
jgi:hypothetical protein